MEIDEPNESESKSISIKTEKIHEPKNESKSKTIKLKIEHINMKVKNEQNEQNVNEWNESENEIKTSFANGFHFPSIETSHSCIMEYLNGDGNEINSNSINNYNGTNGVENANTNCNINDTQNYEIGFKHGKSGYGSNPYFQNDLHYRYGYQAGKSEREIIEMQKKWMKERAIRTELENEFLNYNNIDGIPPVPGQVGRKQFILKQLEKINAPELEIELEKLYEMRWIWTKNNPTNIS